MRPIATTRPTTRRPGTTMLAAGLIVLVALAVPLTPAHATTTWRVGPPGTSAAVDFHLVQDAIDASADGDVVEVLPGEYAELIDFVGKAITVRSSNGPEVTTINGHRDGTVVTFDDDEGPDSVLEGLTVRGGYAWASSGYSGGGIQVDRTSPTIRGNVVVDNAACSTGAGIDVSFGSPTIIDNVISDNFRQGCTGGGGGAGIHVGGDDGGTTLVEGNRIEGNQIGGSGSGGGIELFAAGDIVLRGNAITDNWADRAGGGISIANGTRATIVQNLLRDNRAEVEGGGIDWLVPTSSSPLPSVVVGNTLVGNEAPAGAAASLDGALHQVSFTNNVFTGSDTTAVVSCGDGLNTDRTPTMHNNLLWGWSSDEFAGTCTPPTVADGNIVAFPGFDGDGQVPAPGSPLVDAGRDHPSSPATDLAGNPRVTDGDADGDASIDIGAFEAPEAVAEPPGAPASANATLTDTLLLISWADPEPRGSLPLLGYDVQVGDEVHTTDNVENWLILPRSAADGVTEVSVRAFNVIGPGPWTTTPVRDEELVPFAPTELTAARVGGDVEVSWDLPADDGGSPLTGWVIRWTDESRLMVPEERTLPAEARTFSIPVPPEVGLNVEVAAVNAVGVGQFAWTFVERATSAPGPVRNLLATRIRDEITVTWDEPADDGGSPITGYRVEYGGGSFAVDSDANELVLPAVAGAAGVIVYGINDVGGGAGSSTPIVDLAVAPGAPTDLAAVGDVERVVVSWSPPVDDGGAAIDAYQVEVQPGTATTVAGDTTQFVVDDLGPGETVTVRVRARNRAGTGPVASATATTVDVPTAPRNLTASAQKRDQLVVTWAPPADDGGNQVAGYVVTELRTGAERLVAASAMSTLLTGIDKQSWEVEVVAFNDAGPGPAATIASGGGGDGGGDGGGPPKCHPKKGC